MNERPESYSTLVPWLATAGFMYATARVCVLFAYSHGGTYEYHNHLIISAHINSALGVIDDLFV